MWRFLQYNENCINNQDRQSQTENDERPGAEHPNENDSKDTETKLLQFLMLWPKYYQMVKLQKI